MSQTLVTPEKVTHKLEEVVLGKKSKLLVTKSGEPIKVLKYLEPVFYDFEKDEPSDLDIREGVEELLMGYQEDDLKEIRGDIEHRFIRGDIKLEEAREKMQQLRPKDPSEFFNAYYISEPHVTGSFNGSYRDNFDMPT